MRDREGENERERAREEQVLGCESCVPMIFLSRILSNEKSTKYSEPNEPQNEGAPSV